MLLKLNVALCSQVKIVCRADYVKDPGDKMTYKANFDPRISEQNSSDLSKGQSTILEKLKKKLVHVLQGKCVNCNFSS